ncbi:hypothetical protein Agub_g4293, partial [Astrephomene gubernaculifera]
MPCAATSLLQSTSKALPWQHKTPVAVIRFIHLHNPHIKLAPCAAIRSRNGSGGDSSSPRPRGRPRKQPKHANEASPSPSPSTASAPDPAGSLSNSHPLLKQPAQQQQQDQQQVVKRPRGRPPLKRGDLDAAAAAAPRRPRGRPASPPLTPGALACRDLELRTLLLRHLGMEPEELRPPSASWQRLLASMTPASLAARLAGLEEVLGREAVRHIARRCPHIMQLTPRMISSKLAALNTQLQLPRAQVLQAVCRFPSLLGTDPGAVGGRVALLGALLGKSPEFVSTMVASQPVLLCLAPATLRHRAGLLQEAASLLPNKWGAELRTLAPSTLGRLLRCSDTVLQRLLYIYLRVSQNGKKYGNIFSMSTICCRTAAAWNWEYPRFQDWLADGERDRRSGAVTQWPG